MNRLALCVFSGLSAPNAGGVQCSGRIAWQAIARHARSVGSTAGLLVYGEAEAGDLDLAGDGACVVGNRLGMLRTALLRHWRTPLVCFWHVSMLRLLPLLRVGDAKVVLFLHGIEAWRSFSGLARRALDRVDLFLSNSDFTWQRFLECNPYLADRPHLTIPLGCDEPWFGMDIPPSEPPAALILGRMMRGEDYKGHRELIAAWPSVLRSIPDAELWIGGDGDLRPELEREAASRGLERNLRFWGFLSEEQKLDLLRRCRCLAMPSRGEGFGLVYLEAMRLGRPCLVSNQDAAREVVNPPEAGLAADPAELTDALCRLMSDGHEWQAWSTAASARYERSFTAGHFQNRLLAALFGRGSLIQPGSARQEIACPAD
jgi:phosphatidylinositol alpha-1,6-mannosyltransferase